MALLYAFFCLSAWYVARTPIGPTGAVRVSATALSSSVISSAAWLIVARGWLELFARGETLAHVDRAFPALRALGFGFATLLYLLSLAVSYLLAAFEQSREAERRGLEAQVLAREAELRSLREQIDPISCSIACTDQRLTTADRPRPACVCCGRLSSRQPGAWIGRSHHGCSRGWIGGTLSRN